jgi:hypothetical protein
MRDTIVTSHEGHHTPLSHYMRHTIVTSRVKMIVRGTCSYYVLVCIYGQVSVVPHTTLFPYARAVATIEPTEALVLVKNLYTGRAPEGGQGAPTGLLVQRNYHYYFYGTRFESKVQGLLWFINN